MHTINLVDNVGTAVDVAATRYPVLLGYKCGSSLQFLFALDTLSRGIRSAPGLGRVFSL